MELKIQLSEDVVLLLQPLMLSSAANDTPQVRGVNDGLQFSLSCKGLNSACTAGLPLLVHY